MVTADALLTSLTAELMQTLPEIVARVNPTICETHSRDGSTVEGRILADDWAYLIATIAALGGLLLHYDEAGGLVLTPVQLHNPPVGTTAH